MASPTDTEALRLLREMRDAVDDLPEHLHSEGREIRYRIRDVAGRVGIMPIALAVFAGMLVHTAVVVFALMLWATHVSAEAQQRYDRALESIRSQQP